ncbi:MAG: GNAT family N-acetyltransferase [Chloroflexi bacterium]|nr:GNAT family N-acetyltransferase [Chloroflexota bacterium]
MIKPILRDLPESLQTERLVIRCLRPGDGPSLNAAIMETIGSLQEWMPWARPAPAVEDTEEHCRRGYASFVERKDFPLLLLLKDSGAVVGGTGLHPAGWQVPKFEIGYWCRACYEGQGFITEAVRAITRFGFETMGARRIFIRCDSRNDRSRRVAERCGYRLEAELRNDDIAPGGELRATLVFGKVPEDE